MSAAPDPAVSASAPSPDLGHLGHLASLAARISQHAAQARARAAELDHAVASTRWQGDAARAFEASAADTATGLRRAADRLEDSAAALLRHTHRVDAEVAELARLARTVRDGAEHAAGRLGWLL